MTNGPDSTQSLRDSLAAYANEYPFSGVNRAAAAPKLFAAMREIVNECERAGTDACPERKRLIANIHRIVAQNLVVTA